jgi:beta-lactamase regulating signal transducer with metallopeptidase domain
MTPELYLVYAFNLVINSFLTFLTLVLFVEFLIFAFRIRQPRFRALMFLIPVIKLIIDPFFYNFDSWALTHQINPLEAEVGSRMLSVLICYPKSLAGFLPITTGIQFSVNDCQTFSLADIAALNLSPIIVKGVILIVGVVSFILLIIHLIRLVHAYRILSNLTLKAIPCSRILQNQKLVSRMNKTNIHLIISSTVSAPCSFGLICKRICFPNNFVETLSEGEFEAIIAHELNHLRWHDALIQWLCRCISCLFWWIPTQWYTRRIECAQEMACDSILNQFNISKLDLASAIVKVLKLNQNTRDIPLLSTCFAKDSYISTRLKFLVAESNEKNKLMGWLQIGVVVLIAVSLLFGTFWIF